MKSPDRRGYFGPYGGRFVPETLMSALSQLEQCYQETTSMPSFKAELKSLQCDYVGRPTPLYQANQLTAKVGGATIILKREDLAHTGAHKINNALGQALLAKYMGKTRIVAETGAGQHGVATATACALLCLECVVYMGQEDVERQSENVARMKLLGAEVCAVDAGSRTLKDAINEAIRDWVTNVTNTYFLLGSVVGPHPYPKIVRDFQSVIGKEAKRQMMSRYHRLPDYVVACVGGGSNAMGIFYPFEDSMEVKMVGVEAAGKSLSHGQHSASLAKGSTGVLHGTKTYLLQDEHGQIMCTHSIAPGLDYPGVGPEHSYYKDIGRAEYVVVNDGQALGAFQTLSETEGIIPALESSHAVYYAMKLAGDLPSDTLIVVNLSGRGDKDLHIVLQELELG